MLKYEYNQAKKNIFLSFWQIDNISDYSSKTKHHSIYFTYFTKLSHIQQQALLNILFYAEQKKNLQIKNGTLKLIEKNQVIGIPLSEWSAEPGDVTYLDDVNFISVAKDRSFLNEKRDVAYLVKETLAFFEKTHFLESSCNKLSIFSKNSSLFTLSEPLNELAKKYLIHLAADLIGDDLSEEKIGELLKMEEVIPCISPQKIASLYLPLNEEEGIKEFDDILENQGNERLAYLVHCIDVYLSNQKKFKQTFNEKHLQIEEKKLKPIIEKMRLLGVDRHFHKRLFWQKANILLKIIFAKHLKSLKGLLSQFDENKIYHPIFFFRLLNKFLFEDKHSICRQALSTTSLKKLTSRLIFTGLIEIKKGRGYKINHRSLLKIHTQSSSKKHYEEKNLEDNMFIDTDLGITVYRMNIVPEIFYFLLNIGQLSMDKDIITASWDHNRSTFCETMGMGINRIEKLLDSTTPSNLNETISNYLKSYFYSSDGVEISRGYVLKVSSKTKLVKIAFSLQEAQIPFIKLNEIDGKQAIFFKSKKIFLNGKKVLKERDKTISFF